MLWSDFYPYVSPYVIDCPSPVLDQHIKLAAIEFCRRTSCWQKTLDPSLSNGFNNLVEIDPDTSTQVIKIKAVAVDSIPWATVNSSNGLELVRTGSQQKFCFTQDNKTLFVSPLQTVGIQIIVDAIISPSMTATGIDDVIGGEYASDIAHGAVASIMRVPAFANPNSGIQQQALFERRISTIASKVARGFIGSKMPSYTSFM